jgi:hypothetical protein
MVCTFPHGRSGKSQGNEQCHQGVMRSLQDKPPQDEDFAPAVAGCCGCGSFGVMNQGTLLFAPFRVATPIKGFCAGLEPPAPGCEW